MFFKIAKPILLRLWKAYQINSRLNPSNQLRKNSDRPRQRFDAANDFLTICDRLSTGYDSGYYWEDVQRALRIADGLEKWPD